VAHPHGSVVRSSTSSDAGPALVVSNERRPFQGEEYTVATVSTTERDGAIELTAETLSDGTLAHYPSYVHPWKLDVVWADAVDECVAQVSTETMNRVAQVIVGYLEPG